AGAVEPEGAPRTPGPGTPGRSPDAAERSVGAGSSENRSHGLPQDHEIERQRPVLHVADVDADGVLPGEVRTPADLPQTAESRLDEEAPLHVEAVALHLADQRWARPDQGHLAPQHVEQLRQFVE